MEIYNLRWSCGYIFNIVIAAGCPCYKICAGVGLAVLWRVNPSWKQNLFITGLTWASGAAVGVGIQLVVALAG